MPEAATATTTTTAATTTGAAETTWWSGFDDETKGYVQNKGLAAKPINEAFAQVSKFHREAEKMIGAPANELVRLPKDPNAPEWAGVHKRLGALEKAEDYKFEGLKRAGEKPVGDSLLDTLRKAALAAKASPDNAHKMAQEVVRHFDAEDSAKAADEAAKLDSETKLLKDNWGSKFVANKIVAASAAQALGVSPDAVAALEKVIGYSKVMEMFRSIGEKIGEDKWVQSSTGAGGKEPMTKEAALAEKKALMADEAWAMRYLKGGVEEGRKMTALNTIIVG